MSPSVSYNIGMSFTHEIKQEILDLEFSKEEAFNFIYGLVASAGIETGYFTIIRISTNQYQKHIQDILKELKMEYKKVGSYIQIDSLKRNKEIKHPNYFLAGLFVGGGSVSDFNSTSYHLEIQFHSSSNASKLLPLLNSYNFSFNSIRRRTKTVLYIKKQTEISDFLMAIFAHKSALKFEDARIQRDMYNAINRYSNLDVYNQSKLAKASRNFIRMWMFVEKNNLYHEFNDKEINFFKLKEENQYSSLMELSLLYNEKYNTNKTRAGLNHWIYKLRRIVNKNKIGEDK